MEDAPTIDVHAHVLLPGVEQLVAGQPGLRAHAGLQARRFGSGAPTRPRPGRRCSRSGPSSSTQSSGWPTWTPPASTSSWSARRPCTITTGPSRRSRPSCTGPRTRPSRRTAPPRPACCGASAWPRSRTPRPPSPRSTTRSAPACSASRSPAAAPAASCPTRRWSRSGRAEELGAVIFLHPFGCTLDDRLTPWYLGNIVGQPVENAVALSHLIFSGTLDRHPGLRLIAAHGGGYLPTYLGPLRPRLGGPAGKPRLRRAAQQLPAPDLARLAGAQRPRPAAPGRGGRRGPHRARLGLPVRHGHRRPGRRPARAGLPDADFHAIRGRNALALLQLGTTGGRPAE